MQTRDMLMVFILINFQQRQVEVRRNEELLQSFKEQAAQSATKVCTKTSILLHQLCQI